MSEFSDRPLVAGSLTGVRSFAVDKLGRLTGIHQRQVFAPGENVAKCPGGGGYSAFLREVRSAFPNLEGPAKREHQVAGVDCTCGFYAYFDGSDDYSTSDSVTALIEGYGVCTVGSRGFRAEKARLVALIAPGETRGGRIHTLYDRVADWSTDCHDGLLALGSVGGLLLGLVATVTAFVAPPQTLPLLALGLALIAAAAFVIGADFHAVSRKYPSVSPEVHRCPIPPKGITRRVPIAQVLANYPDVPVYPTLKAALREHPLTEPAPPVLPTPDTDPEFWTRSAS